MNIRNPLFSIVITTYNRADLILETLESVFNQNYKNFEVIIVDDASTDQTIEILRPLVKSEKVKLIVNEINSERCVSRNKGINAATGDFLTLLDSDDFMYKNNLKDAAEFLLQNPECQFFHNYYELVDNKNKKIYNYQFPKKSQFIKKMAEGNFVSCIGNFISKEIYSNYKFNEDPKVMGSEDWELWLRVISTYELGVIPKINNGVRNHAERSVNSLDYEKIIQTKFYIIEHLFKNALFSNKFAPYKKFMISSVFLFAAVGANKYYKFQLAKKYIKKSFLSYPKIFITERFWRVCRNTLLRIRKKH